MGTRDHGPVTPEQEIRDRHEREDRTEQLANVNDKWRIQCSLLADSEVFAEHSENPIVVMVVENLIRTSQTPYDDFIDFANALTGIPRYKLLNYDRK